MTRLADGKSCSDYILKEIKRQNVGKCQKGHVYMYKTMRFECLEAFGSRDIGRISNT